MKNESVTFSSVEFFRPIYDEIQSEMTNWQGRVAKESNLGENSEILENAHKEVLLEIEELSDFCMTCKPPKKKKSKKQH